MKLGDIGNIRFFIISGCSIYFDPTGNLIRTQLLINKIMSNMAKQMIGVYGK